MAAIGSFLDGAAMTQPIARARGWSFPHPRWRDYLELTKPRLSALVLVTTAAGFWLGRQAPEPPLLRLAPLLLGTALVAGGANALNQWRERDLDALMERTKRRPLPAGRLTQQSAYRFGALLSILGVVCLMRFATPLSAVLAAISWASYVLVYTPLKRATPLCTLAGAVPGALPPVIGWAGARNLLGLEAWTLFAIVFLWQLPHFLALARLYHDDYERAGFRLLSTVESDGAAAARQAALYGLALLPGSLFPTLLGLAGGWYFCGALVLSAGFFLLALRAAWCRSRQTARQLFHASLLYLPALLGLWTLNRV